MKSQKGYSRRVLDASVQAGWSYQLAMRDHRSLRVWQRARLVSIEVIRLAQSSWKPYAAALFSQLLKASLSVQLNLAEGYSYGDSPTFTKHLGIAYGSAVETEELLQLARDARILSNDIVEPLLQQNQETKWMLLGMLRRRRKFPSATKQVRSTGK